MPASAVATKGAASKGLGGYLVHKILVETVINGSIIASVKAVGYHGAAYMWAGLLGGAVGAPVGLLMVLGATSREIYSEAEQPTRAAAGCCAGGACGAAASMYCVGTCLPLCGEPSNILVQTLIIRQVSCEFAPMCGGACAAAVAEPAAGCATTCRRKLLLPKDEKNEEEEPHSNIEMDERKTIR